MYIRQIDFVGEAAVDTGGPLREFWRLLGIEISLKFFVRYDEQRKTLRFNADYLRVRECGIVHFHS